MLNYPVLHDKQLDGTVCGQSNCNMCAAAMLARRMTLGIVSVSGDIIRKLSGTEGRCVDGVNGNDGTSQQDALNALAKLDLRPVAYQTVDVAKLHESAGKGCILSIDYGALPVSLRGDREFTGNHAIFLNDFLAGKYLRLDSICDGRTDYPSGRRAPNDAPFGTWTDAAPYDAAAEAYKAGGGNIYCVVNRNIVYVGPREDYCNVRATPSRKEPPIYVLRSGKLETAQRSLGTDPAVPRPVYGESVSGTNVWYKVWMPAINRTGYVHSSVSKEVA